MKLLSFSSPFFCFAIVLLSLTIIFSFEDNFEIIYIDESENLQNKFAKYVNTNFENDPCKQKTHTYQRTFVENPKERQNICLN